MTVPGKFTNGQIDVLKSLLAIGAYPDGPQATGVRPLDLGANAKSHHSNSLKWLMPIIVQRRAIGRDWGAAPTSHPGRETYRYRLTEYGRRVALKLSDIPDLSSMSRAKAVAMIAGLSDEAAGIAR